MTTLYRSPSRTDWYSESRGLVGASNGGRSSASRLTSLQGGDHLTPTSYSDRWLQLILPSTASSRAGLTSSCQPPTSSVSSRLTLSRTIFQLPNWRSQSQCQCQGYVMTDSQRPVGSLCSLCADCVENIASNSSSIVACARCLAMALVLLSIYEAVI
jgi:hypothetical protein